MTDKEERKNKQKNTSVEIKNDQNLSEKSERSNKSNLTENLVQSDDGALNKESKELEHEDGYASDIEKVNESKQSKSDKKAGEQESPDEKPADNNMSKKKQKKANKPQAKKLDNNQEKKSHPKKDRKEALAEAEFAWEKSKKRKKIRNAILIILGIIVAAYGGCTAFFMYHFYPNTEINGNLFSMKNDEQVENFMEGQVKNYTLTMLESDGDKEVISGDQIDLKYVPGDDVQKLLEKQNPFLWITAFWEKPVIESPIGVEYNKNKLSRLIEHLKCMTDEPIPSISAHPEFKDTQFEIVPEVFGTEINKEKFEEVINEAISGFLPEIDMVKEKCYVFPQFTSESKEVEDAKNTMNGYLGANITLDFNPSTEVVDAAQIAQWVAADENMQVTFNQDLVRAYVASLAEKYDTYGKPRSFVTGYGNTVQVEGGNYGWKIDQEAEFNALIANIQNAETVTREPNYSSRGITHEGNDFGNTYVEVDLTNQHLFFFQNGQCTLQSDVVTGNPQHGNGTPQGTYTLAYKQRNQVLRGPKKEDGTYEWESPVAYWMPFNGGIGLHDAPWRGAFGGSIYNGNGSHGCVNLPPSFAGQLYDVVDSGTPVICHY